MTTVYIHADAAGTYQGNGGFICLNELGFRLGQMGYTVAWFDHADRLRPEMWNWTGYAVPEIVSWYDVLHGVAPVVTTWLYSWLDALQQQPDLWPRLRYWCSGELLRADPIHDAARAFVREHIQVIAINNPALTEAYEDLEIYQHWNWTNWVRDLFHEDVARRESGLIGFQTDTPNGLEGINCVGTQADVAAAMRRCDLFFSWNMLWPLVCGAGESFGLSLYEAMVSGCACVTRAHCGNTAVAGYVFRAETLEQAYDRLAQMRTDRDVRERDRRQQRHFIQRYRFDGARARAIRGYLNV